MREAFEKENDKELANFFSSRIVISTNIPTQEGSLSSEEEESSSQASLEALHKKAKEMSQRQKDYGYSKYRDSFWYSHYKKDENRFETGLRLSILKEEYFTNYSHCNNEYVYIKETSTLFYIAEDKAEKVNIEDFVRFETELKVIMDTEYERYLTKHLSYEEIKTLITSNGGHAPHSIPLNSTYANQI